MIALSRGPGNAGTCRPSACAALTPVKSVVWPVPLCGRPSTPSVASTSRTTGPARCERSPRPAARRRAPRSTGSDAIGERVAASARAETDAVDEDDEDGPGLAHRGRLYRVRRPDRASRTGVILPAMAARPPGKKGIKSAYERALERMESEGIERPREEAFIAGVLAGHGRGAQARRGQARRARDPAQGTAAHAPGPGGVRQRGEGVPGRAQAHRGAARARHRLATGR